jgi:hypothetical protein
MKQNFENFKWFWKDALTIFEKKKWYLFPFMLFALIISSPITIFISLILLTEDPKEREEYEKMLDSIIEGK